MKIIFLDIDGVLNSELWFRKRESQNGAIDDFDPDCVKNLNTIIKDTDAKIVLSSTWRKSYDTVEKAQKLFNDVGIIGECIGLTPVLYYKKSSYSVQRGAEIQEYIRTHLHLDWNYRQYAIIDDDSDMLYSQRNNFFQTDAYCGLSPNIAYKVTHFLNGFN